MKHSVWILSLVLFVQVAKAQDVMQVSPSIYKVAFENEKVRVLEGTFKPGDKTGLHSHPDHFVYVLAGGKLTITKPGGAPQSFDLKTGQVVWIPAESHIGENTGKTTVRLLVNELKETAVPQVDIVR
jgi:beta-alanine degradation protein BauB